MICEWFCKLFERFCRLCECLCCCCCNLNKCFKTFVPPKCELFEYDDLILTTIELDLPDGKKREDLEHDDPVSFTEAAGNAKEAAFLRNIKEVKECGKWIFKATYVSKEEAAKIAKGWPCGKDHTTVFCIHGCCGNPRNILYPSKGMQERFKKEGKCYLIPVMWPTQSGTFWDLITPSRGGWPGIWALLPGYYKDWKTFAPDAGGILAKLVNDIKDGSFGKVSLMCHSMGNHLVFNNAGLQKASEESSGAPTGVNFENIFMVGADVSSDIFSKDAEQSCCNFKTDFSCCNSETDFPDKKLRALKMKEMVGGGKIYVVHTHVDVALNLSMFAKLFRVGIPRLGFSGAKDIDEDVFGGTVVNFDATQKIDEEEKYHDRVITHLYNFEPWAVKFYEFIESNDEASIRNEYFKTNEKC